MIGRLNRTAWEAPVVKITALAVVRTKGPFRIIFRKAYFIAR